MTTRKNRPEFIVYVGAPFWSGNSLVGLLWDRDMSHDSRENLLKMIREAFAGSNSEWMSRKRFLQEAELKDSDLFRHFASWSEAVAAAGIDQRPYNQKISIDELFEDWGNLVRRERAIPTRNRYKIDGGFSPGVFESNFGPWSEIPRRFREWALEKREWADVLAILPPEAPHEEAAPTSGRPAAASLRMRDPFSRHRRLNDRPTYGDPVDFRGLRHAPVNENGVVFLFGMVARELGYSVEAIQIGFPDCEAKRQLAPGKWQRVRIEFEFESRNFVEHGHDPSGCDVLVCWNHNWADAPDSLEIVELRKVISSLSKSDE